jgi:ferredoxin
VLLQRFLRWKHARLALQLPLLFLAVCIIVDGFYGPALAPMNLAGVLPWIHWRGLLVLTLLIAGNFFCTACPFTLPRRLAKKLLGGEHPWPRRLRSKWLAVALLVIFFLVYELFSLWDRPTWTAAIALGYFLAAFIVEGRFRGASFCKYVCPIGQFNFVQSLVSPLEVKVREPATCLSCRTRECIRGGPDITGCELHLFQPRKAGNLDCTFCLACIQACPHDNVGILSVVPGAELLHDRPRSGLGRSSRRLDVAALVLVLVFASFANAAAMTAPVQEAATLLGGRYASALLATGLGLALLPLPLLLVGGTAALSRQAGRLSETTLHVAIRFTLTLVPLGFGMWLAHYGFHFLSSAGALSAVAQRVGHDLGFAFLGPPEWMRACCLAPAAWITRLELLFLDGGLLASLYLAYRLAGSLVKQSSDALAAFLPWAMLLTLLFAAGVWIVLQPMQMRGLLGG